MIKLTTYKDHPFISEVDGYFDTISKVTGKDVMITQTPCFTYKSKFLTIQTYSSSMGVLDILEKGKQYIFFLSDEMENNILYDRHIRLVII